MSGLEALDKLKNEHIFIDFELDFNIGEQYKNELDAIEKELKVLAIIKEKGGLVFRPSNYTKEEYMLLKEVFRLLWLNMQFFSKVITSQLSY